MNKSTDLSAQIKLTNNIGEILRILLGDIENLDGLTKTPERYAKALLYLTKGYKENAVEIVGDAIFDSDVEDIVIVKDIEFYSLCEHHLLPFFGKVSIGYIPDGKVIGISKLARIVDMYARRLQLQEKMTLEICEELGKLFPNKGVIVFSEAEHLCMKMRGVEKQSCSTISCASVGLFKSDKEMKRQFMEELKK